MSIDGKKLNKYVADYVVFDLETTGLSSEDDAIIEISAIKVRGGKAIDEYSTLVNPERPIPFRASEVNKIYDNMVADSPMIKDALTEFLSFAGSDVLVGHNIASFDLKFIARDADKYLHCHVKNDYIDTLTLSRIYLSNLGHHSLSELARYYGISTDGAHRALNDCRMNQQVYEQLAKEMGKPLPESTKLCPRCGAILKKRNGKFGEFWGCTGFPACRYTQNV